MQSMLSSLQLNYSSFSFVASLKSSVVPPSKDNPLFSKYIPKHFNLNNNKSTSNSCAATMTSFADTYGVVSTPNKVDDGNKMEEETYAEVGLKQGEGMIPKHATLSLDGNRRWLKLHGLDLSYMPFFEANMRFAEYCLKWGVTTATSYIYGVGNMKHRTKEANDLIIGQFERFLEEGLEYFIRNGVKVSIVGELWMLPQSCQSTIEKVEEATKNNTKLDLMLPMCYTSQRDIVQATKEICKKVQEGTMELEGVTEDLVEQHLSLCSSRPAPDLFIRTGGQLRMGMLMGWEVPHVELYFTSIHAPDFGEDVFLDALRSFQQRARLFGILCGRFHDIVYEDECLSSKWWQCGTKLERLAT